MTRAVAWLLGLWIVVVLLGGLLTALDHDRRHREHEAHLKLMDTLVLRLTDNDGTLRFKHNALSQDVAKARKPWWWEAWK